MYPNRTGDIQTAVDACILETPDGSCPIFAAASNGVGCGNGGVNGKIGSWDVSGVVDMSNLFYGQEFFVADLSKWNVGAVTTMYCSTC